ncbi:hypothetical protein CU097_004950 [Rhizopus azygosporus]|uniref:Cytochrome P450 n=2 Tax=Rhizopus TaxID=4842 RepID=A0A367J1R7_RHIAZ|nr:hypothetical protein CU097_004950 [Rhizopus azygosporus]
MLMLAYIYEYFAFLSYKYRSLSHNMNYIGLDKKSEHLYLSAGALITAFVLLKSTSRLLSNNSKEQIPVVPYKLPFVGSTIDYYKNTLEFTKKWSKKYGSAFKMHLHGQWVTVVGADDAPEVFTHPSLSFLAGQVEFLGQTTAHANSRYSLSPEIVKQSIVKHLTPHLDNYCPQGFEMIIKHAKHVLNEPEVVVPDLLPFLRSFVARYSASAFVGKELCTDENLMNAFENAVSEIGKEMTPGLFRVIFPFFNKLYLKFLYPRTAAIDKHRMLIKNALAADIERRKASPEQKEPSGILGYILEAHPQEEIDDAYLESLTAVILIFIFVGVHTTSMAAAAVMYRLVAHPQYIPELLEEQKQVSETADAQDFVPSAYRQMPKLDSFIRESMRTRATGIALPHKNITDKDVVLRSGAIVRPGEDVYINMWHIHFDEANQGHTGDADQFLGFRFVGQDKQTTKTGHDFVSFGLGKRACPGRWFATQQIKGIVSYLIRHYEMRPAGDILISGEKGYSKPSTGPVGFIKKETK